MRAGGAARRLLLGSHVFEVGVDSFNGESNGGCSTRWFVIVFPAENGSTLSLYYSDMTRTRRDPGRLLFCKALSGGNRYFEKDAGTATITEAA